MTKSRSKVKMVYINWLIVFPNKKFRAKYLTKITRKVEKYVLDNHPQGTDSNVPKYAFLGHKVDSITHSRAVRGLFE